MPQGVTHVPSGGSRYISPGPKGPTALPAWPAAARLLAGDGLSSRGGRVRQAGIDRARGLVCAVDSDAANVFITLTARALNPDLRIVARASEAASAGKLVRAGADEVVSPYGLTGRRMAVLAVQPSVLEVLDLLNLGSDIRLEEVAVRAGTHLDSLTIAGARARYAGVAILALKKPGNEVSANPDHQVRLAPGDLIVVLGPAEILNRMAD
jgi:voltage-gated potassium channel